MHGTSSMKYQNSVNRVRIAAVSVLCIWHSRYPLHLSILEQAALKASLHRPKPGGKSACLVQILKICKPVVETVLTSETGGDCLHMLAALTVRVACWGGLRHKCLEQISFTHRSHDYGELKVEETLCVINSKCLMSCYLTILCKHQGTLFKWWQTKQLHSADSVVIPVTATYAALFQTSL